MPRALLIFPITLSLFGQSTTPSPADGYATTDDGRQLYFVSSFMLRGSTGETIYPKLFRYDGRNFSLAVQIPLTDRFNPNFFDILSPRISGDGSVVGYVATQGCANSCNVVGGYQTTLQFPGKAAPLMLPYYCQISRNAKYALCVTAQPALQQVAIVDLSTMQMSASQFTACHGPYLITSDGRALAWDQKQLVLFDATSVQPIANDAIGCPLISDDGSVIVYPSHQGLVFYSVAKASTITLAPTCNFCGVGAPSAISNDGTLVLARGALIRTDGGGSSVLKTAPDILSGNGLVAYAGLSKVDATGVVTQLAEPTPQITMLSPFLVPGSYYVAGGTNLSAASAVATSFPGPTALADVQILINGTPVPLLSVSPTAVAFQMPWEAPASTTLELISGTSSPFVQGPFHLGLVPFWAYSLGPAITEDFSAIITPSNPANPGDIVNFYLSGMGAVTTPVADAVPTPASPLPLLASAITVSYGKTPLKIYYAGLAPGLIGIYQLTVQTPGQVSPQVPGGSGPTYVNLGLQLSPPQSAAPFNLTVVMTPNQSSVLPRP